MTSDVRIENPDDDPRIIMVNSGMSMRFKITVILVTVLVVGFMTLSQMFAWERVRAVRGDLDELQLVTFYSDSKSNCLALYRNDLTVAMGMAIAASNDLWISVATRSETGDTPEDKAALAEDNKRLGETLALSNTPLIAAAEALEDYDKLDPPPDHCPHPDSLVSFFPPPVGNT